MINIFVGIGVVIFFSICFFLIVKYFNRRDLKENIEILDKTYEMLKVEDDLYHYRGFWEFVKKFVGDDIKLNDKKEKIEKLFEKFSNIEDNGQIKLF